MNQNLLNIALTLIITLSLGFLLGLAIVRVVDYRLSQVSINLSKQNLGKSFQKANEIKKSFNEGYMKINNLTGSTDVRENFTNPPIDHEAMSPTFTRGQEQDDSILTSVYVKDFVKPVNPNYPAIDNQVESSQVGHIQTDKSTMGLAIDQVDGEVKATQQCAGASGQTRPEVGCQNDNDCNVVFGQGKNRCLSNHKCYCVEGSGIFCHYGPTYYKDPKDMTDRQRQKFKLRANMDKMTVQDYVNWLMLFVDDVDSLAPRHLSNFRKVRRGIRLTLNDIPREKIPAPMTAHDYFTNLYNLDDQINIYSPQVSNTAGVQLPANYDQYSTFVAPQNLKHMNTRNLTLDQEMTKQANKEVLSKTRAEISNKWEKSVN